MPACMRPRLSSQNRQIHRVRCLGELFRGCNYCSFLEPCWTKLLERAGVTLTCCGVGHAGATGPYPVGLCSRSGYRFPVRISAHQPHGQVLFCVFRVSVCSSGCHGAPYVDEARLPRPLECWDQRCLPSCLASVPALTEACRRQELCLLLSCTLGHRDDGHRGLLQVSPREAMEPDTGLVGSRD